MPRKKDGIHKHSGYVVKANQKGHPLADTQGKLFEHQYVLYNKIGPGEHQCHHCGRSVRWRDPEWAHKLCVDHLDWNRVNNDPANLVPSCMKCNFDRPDPARQAATEAKRIAKAEQKKRLEQAHRAAADAYGKKVTQNPAQWKQIAAKLGLSQETARQYLRMAGVAHLLLPPVEKLTVHNSVTGTISEHWAMSTHQRCKLMRDYLWLVDMGLVKCSVLANHFGVHPNSVRSAVKALRSAS